MSFDYDKIAGKEGEHTSWWTSYADLFMMLSIVFLLMYVASSLRAGSAGFQQQQENQQLQQKAAGLEQQIKVYNTLKDEALKKQTSEAEQQVYQKLMDKLTLLKEDARDEKIALRAKAKENEDKEFALNQYQQLVKNIISANILAKTQIQHRDQLIVTKDATIEEKKQKISEMEEIVAQNDQQIQTIHSQLEQQIEAVREEQSHSKSSKIAMEKRITAMRNDSEAKIQAIEAKKASIAQELTQVKSTLQDTSAKLDDAHSTIAQQDQTIVQKDQTISQKEQTIAEKEQEKGALAAKLEADKARYASELTDLKAQHDQQLANERQTFMANLKKQKLTADARARKIAKFAADAEAKAGQLEGQLSGLQNKISETDSQLKGAQAEYEAARHKLAGTQQALAGTQQALAGTQQKLSGTQQALSGTQQALANTEAEKSRALAAVGELQGDLAKTRAIANARKILAKQIADEFAKAGIKGNVDGKTGEVTLDFGGEYFETGSTNLKPKMRTTLDKFIPTYAKSLFSNPKLADKIGNVEIVGFASSTYKGRYVNPKSTRAEDKAAIEYNLKLSFGRANSIFNHVLNSKNLTRDEREKLMPLMKVVGRGYLPDGVSASDLPDSMSDTDFCEKYNCKKAQRVVVKFNMKD